MATTDTNQELELEPRDHGLRTRVIIGLMASAFLVIGLGGWAALANLSGAIIAAGQIVVENNVKKVQHPSGGIIGSLKVKNGDRVQSGELLLTLDDTVTRANLGVLISQVDQLRGRKARLEAERDNRAELRFPVGFESISSEAAEIAASERQLHTIRRQLLSSQKQQLKERIGQLKEEITGQTVQIKAKDKELALIAEELSRVLEMFKRNLVPVTRVTPLQREQARIDGERGALIAGSARTKGQITEIETQIITTDLNMRTDALRDLREVEAKLSELAEKKIAAEDQLKRIEVRAPQSGFVHEMNVHTVGGVINAAETVMQIVPFEDALTIEVRVPVTDIDQVVIGREAVLRFSAFNQRTTPEVPGVVTRISADAVKEQQTGQTYYVARLAMLPEAAGKLKDVKLVPGMPVEAMIATTSRTALSYLLKPFTDNLKRAMRED